jgi:hypothetical protein
MTRKPRQLAALATVALIGVIGAGCGSDTPSETSVASSTGTAAGIDGVSSTGTASDTGAGSDRRAADRDKVATHSPAGSLPPRTPSSSSPGRLPSARSRQPATTGALSPKPNSPQSPHDWRRHE